MSAPAGDGAGNVATDGAVHVLVVDDETPSRALLIDALGLAPSALRVHEAADAASALLVVEREPIRVAFLDIGLPGMNGLSLAGALRERATAPAIVFVTGEDGHALKGFDLGVADYVVKPFERARLLRALGRAMERAPAEASEPRPDRTDRLWAERANGARLLVPVAGIDWVRGERRGVRLHTADGELASRLTLAELEARLPPDRFVRVHRGWIVNLDRVVEVIPWDSHRMTLVMGDAAATEIPVGRAHGDALKRIAGW